MSTSLQEDLDYAYTSLAKKYDEKHGIIYANTNENLLPIFENLDVSDKNILAVMSSGDYYIMSNLFGAKKVDCFDINPLTYRYFFLRKWLVQNGILDLELCHYDEMFKILDSVTSFSSEYEKESLEFWKEILKKFKEKDYWHNGLIHTYFNPLFYYYAKREDEIKRIFNLESPSFYNINVCDESGLGIDKKYDYIFISNILDCRNRTPERLKIIIQNLLDVLDKNGSIVCTHFPEYFNIDYSKTLVPEIEAFSDEFTYNLITEESNGCGNIAYMYTRKN